MHHQINKACVHIIAIGLIILVSCTARDKFLVAQHSPQELGDAFVNKLKQAGVDTIIAYYRGGASNGSVNPHFVYWEHSGVNNLVLFTQYAFYDTIQHSGFAIPSRDTLDRIEQERLEYGNWLISHELIHQVYIKTADNDISYMIKQSDEFANEWTLRKIFIDKFRSYLFDLMKDFRAYNYKEKKANRH